MGYWRARLPVRLQRKWCTNTSLKIGRDAAPPASHTSGAPAPLRGCKGGSSLRSVRLRLGKSATEVGQRRRAVPNLGSMGYWRARSPVRLQRKWCTNTSLKIGRDAAPPASHTSGAPALFRGYKGGLQPPHCATTAWQVRRGSRTAAARRPYPWFDGRLACEVADELATQMVHQHLPEYW